MPLIGSESYRQLTPETIAKKFLVTMARRDKATAAKLTGHYQRILRTIDEEEAKATRALRRSFDENEPPHLAVAKLQRVIRTIGFVDRVTEALSFWSAIADGDIAGIYLEATAWSMKDSMKALADVTTVSPLGQLPEKAIGAIIGQTDPPLTAQSVLDMTPVQQAELVTGLSPAEKKAVRDATIEGGEDFWKAVDAVRGATPGRYPVRAVLEEMGPAVAQAASDTLVDGVALGRNPRVVADKLTAIGLQPLNRALTIARTEMLRAYRESSRAIWREYPEDVDGWIWVCALDSRSCASCIAQHGSFHPVEESMATHPNCRCAMAPWASILGDPEDETARLAAGMPLPDDGAAWLETQPDSVKRAILGKRGLAEYQRGNVILSDFVRRTDSAVWGAGSTQASLKQARLNARLAGRGVESGVYSSAGGWGSGASRRLLFFHRPDYPHSDVVAAKKLANRRAKERMLADGFDVDAWSFNKRRATHAGAFTIDAQGHIAELSNFANVADLRRAIGPDAFRAFHQSAVDDLTDSVRSYIDAWAGSSYDDNLTSITLQRLAREELNIDTPFYRGLRRTVTEADITRMIATDGDSMRAYLRATYANTQDYLRKQGIEALDLVRGMHRPAWAPRLRRTSPAVPWPVQMQPLSSWSTETFQADQFGSFRMATNVPAERIFSTPWTGPGCLNEAEVVVMGGAGDTAWIVPGDRPWTPTHPTASHPGEWNVDEHIADFDNLSQVDRNKLLADLTSEVG